MPRRPPRELGRTRATRPERTTIKVFCEGEKTERLYINALKSLPVVRRRAAVNIDSLHGSPMTLVRGAIATLDDDEVDQRWCVFDVEAPVPHGDLLEAVELARRGGISTAISNPCFELWLVLHHEDAGGYLTTQVVPPRQPVVLDAGVPRRHRGMITAVDVGRRRRGERRRRP